jgi:hypothetical protein
MVVKKTIEIDYAEGEGIEKVEFKGNITLKELTYGEWNSYQEGITSITTGRAASVSVSVSKTMELAILKSHVEGSLMRTTYQEDKPTKVPVPITAPYPLNTITAIQNLPRKVGDQLMKLFSELNEVDEKKS